MYLFLTVFIISFLPGIASAATINVNHSSNAIKNAISTASPGDTLKLAAGTYNEYGLKVNKNLIITGPATTGTPKATIKGNGITDRSNRIFIIPSGVKVTLKYLTITKGYDILSDGGGIYNSGNLAITHCNIQDNFADNFGGGIFNSGTLTVTGSTIKGNVAKTGGGGIFNNGKLAVTGSTIKNNLAFKDGGGIYNSGTLTVTGCNFDLNKGKGNAIYNNGGFTSSRIVHFNRFNELTGYEIYSRSGTVDAKYNWWGSNSKPNSKVSGNVATNPWLILKIKANPSLIKKNGKSTITIDLTHDSKGVYHDPAKGHFPDKIFLKLFLGGTSKTVSTLNGIVKGILTGGSVSGVKRILTYLDEQVVQIPVTIDTTIPRMSNVDPKSGANKVARSKTIKVTFNENIKAGNKYWIELKTSSGKSVKINKSISGKVLYIKHAKLAAKTKYKLYIHTSSITDKAGNPVAAKTYTFTTGRT